MENLEIFCILLILYSEKIYCNQILMHLEKGSLFEANLQEIIEKLFGPNETLQIVVDHNINSATISGEMKNPRTVILLEEPIKLTLNLFNSYLIFIRNPEQLNNTFSKLKTTSVWNESKSPRGRFLVIVQSGQNAEDLFKYFWNNYIMNVVAIIIKDATVSNFSLLTGNPFELNIHEIRAVEIQNVSFFRRIQNLNGFEIKIMVVENVTGAIDADVNALFGVMVTLTRIIAQVLKTNASFIISGTNKTILYDRSKDITISLELARMSHLYDDYDASDYFYKDHVAWIVPIATKISGFTLIVSVFSGPAWTLVLLSSILITFVSYGIGRFFGDRTNLGKSFMTILALSTNGCVRILPKTHALRIVLIFYLLYAIEILSMFQGKLISVITHPHRANQITSVEELADSDLVPISADITLRTMQKLAKTSAAYEKLLRKAMVPKRYNMTEALIKVAYDRSYSAVAGNAMMKRIFPRMRPMIHIIDQNTGLIDMEPVVVMRKGHYLLDTFNRLGRRMVEAGLYDKWFSDAVSRNHFVEEEGDKIVLSMEHLEGLFSLWGIGVGFAAVAFLGERVLFKYLGRNSITC